MKELILLKVTKAKNVWFVTIGFSEICSNIKIIPEMAVMIWRCCFLILVALLLSLLKGLIIVALLMTLANLRQFIC